MVIMGSSVPRRVARFQPAWRKCMPMTRRPASTIAFIGLSETNTIGYYLTPTCVAHRALQEPSLGELARVIKAGACIEASFQRGKGEAGMDEYQVRTWEGWHHHLALTLIAVWFLIEETHRGQQWTPALT